jgi:hypothetical protein
MNRNDEFAHGGDSEGDDAKVIDLGSVRDKKAANNSEHERLHTEAAAINSGFGPRMKPRADQWYRDADSLSKEIGKPLIHPHTGECSMCGKGFFV